MNPYAAIAAGVGVVLLALIPRRGRRGRVATFALPPSTPEVDDWDEPIRVVSNVPRTGSPATSAPQAQSSARTAPAPAPAPAARPAPPPRVVTPPGTDRRVAATQTILNEIHAYIASASGAGNPLHPQINVTGRLDANTFRSWNMLCQTAHGLRHARGCLPWFSGYPLATAWAPAAPIRDVWATQAGFEAAFNANAKVTPAIYGTAPMTITEWLERVYVNRTRENAAMHLDALAEYWKHARRGGCWRYT
jgi:hypothetical protein